SARPGDRDFVDVVARRENDFIADSERAERTKFGSQLSPVRNFARAGAEIDVDLRRADRDGDAVAVERGKGHVRRNRDIVDAGGKADACEVVAADRQRIVGVVRHDVEEAALDAYGPGGSAAVQ